MGANYSSKILNNAVRSISAQQAVIATTSNNIANVNTPGYARRTVQLETNTVLGRSAGLSVGNGVKVADIQRSTDTMIENLLRNATASKFSTEAQNEMLSRLEGLFSLTGDTETVGSTMTAFFDAVDNLSMDPSSIELRAELIERGKDLANTIQKTYSELASLQSEADSRLQTEIGSVNNLTEQIAELNGIISANERNGNIAADERDRRDKLVEELSEKLSFELLEQQDGTVTISLDNGFPLVSGVSHRALEYTQNPSFASGPLPPSLEGGVLGYITYNYGDSTNPSHLDLTQNIGNGEGTLGGLLALRGINDSSNTSAFDATGSIVQIASRVEAIAQTLLTTINQEYLGPDRDGGTAGHQPSSGDLDGNSPGVYGLFTFTGAVDSDGDGLPNDLGAGGIGFDNYASVIEFGVSDPRAIAAARDASGGPPAAASFPTGDNSNLMALSGLQVSDHSFSVGSYTLSGTFDEAYNELVVTVSNAKSRAETQASVAEANLTSAQNRRDEVSAVSLDEEFTNLIKFQRAFEASARMIRVSDELSQLIVGLL